MDFDEYWKNGCFGEYHDIYAKNLADKFYQAGQQSKQAEIGELKKKIDAVKELSEHWYKSSGSALALNVLELLK